MQQSRQAAIRAQAALYERAAREAGEQVLAEMRANRAAGRLPPLRIKPSDIQFDHQREADEQGVAIEKL